MCFPSTLIKLVVKRLYYYFSGKPEFVYHWQKFVSLLLFFLIKWSIQFLKTQTYVKKKEKILRICHRHTMAADTLARCFYFLCVFHVGRQMST